MEQGILHKRSDRQWEARAKSLIKRHRSRARVVELLVKEGLDSEAADNYASRGIESIRSRAMATFGFGAIAFVLGLVVTIGSYAAASSDPYGGVYFIWYGPVIFGGMTALIGLGRLFSAKID